MVGLFMSAVFLLSTTTEFVESGGTLYLQFLEFDNPDGEGSNGHCCDGRGVVCQSDGCDHYFEICVTNRSDTDAGCKESGYVKTSRIDNENHIVFGDTIGDTNNPIRIDQVEYLDSSYTIVVKVKDWDRWNSDDHVDDLIGRVELSAAWSTGQPIILWGRTQLTMKVWFECSDDYYDCEDCEGGARCDKFCHVDQSHGFCDQHGNPVCNQGWTGNGCLKRVTTTVSTTTTTPITTTTGSISVTTHSDGTVEFVYNSTTYYLLPGMMTKWEAEGTCITRDVHSNLAYIRSDREAIAIGNILVNADIFSEFWVQGYSWGENNEPISSLERDVSMAGPRCVILSSYTEPGNPNTTALDFNAYTKICDHYVSGALCVQH